MLVGGRHSVFFPYSDSVLPSSVRGASIHHKGVNAIIMPLKLALDDSQVRISQMLTQRFEFDKR